MFLLLLLACTKDPVADSPVDSSDTDGSRFGLDARPDNPDCVGFSPPGTGDKPLPTSLIATRCVPADDPLRAAPGLIPYDLVAPFWSDGADKHRFLGLPATGTVTVHADGDLEFPIGTVIMKTFDVGGLRIETRLLVRHADGVWGGYAYAWSDPPTDAALLTTYTERELDGQTWVYPGPFDCQYCHTDAAGNTLGPELGQLNRPIRYPSGVESNQLDTLDHIGVFSPPLGVPAADLPAFVDPYGAAPVEERARTWLHTNCSHCHRPGGPTGRPMDLRVSRTLAETQTCDAVPLLDQGVADARILAPGEPDRSLLYVRPVTEASRMPPIGSTVVDVDGGALLRDWIAAIPACP